MKKHGFRSIFSLLLALMMVCSMLPTAAFAEGDAEEQSVVVETYTVTYADGMGGAAFPEQKTDGLRYGDSTPAFAGEPALDGYTFTGWDQEIAGTVTQSVTYTALWQEVQSDVQPEADGNGETDMQNGPDGRPPLNPDGGHGGPGHWNPDVGDTVTWGHDAESVYNVAPRAAGTITITVKVFDGNQEYTVGSDTAKKANKGVQSEAYVIPELTKFVEAGKFGKVTGVYGNWYWPGTTNRAVGTTIYWSNNSSTGTMIYYVDWYNPNGGGDNPTPPPTICGTSPCTMMPTAAPAHPPTNFMVRTANMRRVMILPSLERNLPARAIPLRAGVTPRMAVSLIRRAENAM